MSHKSPVPSELPYSLFKNTTKIIEFHVFRATLSEAFNFPLEEIPEYHKCITGSVKKNLKPADFLKLW